MDVVLGLAFVVATVVGPALAVIVTRHIDDERRVRERRLDVFRALMATRRSPLALDRVRALNVVEIEFYGIGAVETSYSADMTHANMHRPLPASWDDEHRKLITKLLTEMAKVLDYNLQQLDVLDGGYYPEGLTNIEVEQQSVRQAIIAVLSGRRPLNISPAAPTPLAPYPPPPAPIVAKP